MNAQTIIERAQNSGLKLWAGESGALRYSGDAHTFEQLRPELIANKAAILKALVHTGEVEVWLRQKLDSIQPAKTIEVEAALMGYTMEELDTALIRIGGVRSQCLGVSYWRLPDKFDRDAVRDTLARFAAELGFEWRELLGVGLIQECDFDQFAETWSQCTDDQWRDFIASVGKRARNNCPGLVHRITCDCGGQCRTFGAQP